MYSQMMFHLSHSWALLLRNLSSALIDTLVTLYDDATERIAGAERLIPMVGPISSPCYGGSHGTHWILGYDSV